MKKINQYKRTYNMEMGAVIALYFAGILFLVPPKVEEPVQVVEQSKKAVKTASTTLESKLRQYFPKSFVTMIAIAKAESGMRNNVTNFNCYYNSDMSIVYETKVKGSHGASCKPQHRKYSFGVDCFVLQAHYPGRKSCPTNVTLDQHLKEMADLSRARSFQPWSTYNAGLHEKHLANK